MHKHIETTILFIHEHIKLLLEPIKYIAKDYK